MVACRAEEAWTSRLVQKRERRLRFEVALTWTLIGAVLRCVDLAERVQTEILKKYAKARPEEVRGSVDVPLGQSQGCLSQDHDGSQEGSSGTEQVREDCVESQCH